MQAGDDGRSAPTAPAHSRDGPDVEIAERRVGFDGFFKLLLLRLRYRRFDGSMSAWLKREQFHIPQAVCILPYDPGRDELVLIEQFRCGAMEVPEGPWLLEVVAGLVEEGESIEATAWREIEEESGLRPKALERIGRYVPSPGAVTEHTTAFIAHVDTDRAGGVWGVESEGEDIRSHVLASEEAFAWLDEGRIVAANAVICLRWLQLHRDALRRRWREA